ncbi:MAG: hypothetical protein N4A48_03225 [Tepidibacter sp.]|uniref:hypothetical protein n=1 Tax=Tepidibacter sp. TaxID=2529387 RepID=UPI0025E5175B|nr:hypothetical protein [Tepidibacter sp.]MCT4507759.1 hypothetical protein [Tepidibacter sp.]
MHNKRDDILKNAKSYHKTFYNQKTFTGPSLYFHKRALEVLNTNDLENSIEYVYAVLTSWGMHRMGPTGAKMIEFDVFKESILNIKERIQFLKQYSFKTINETVLEQIEYIFKNICVMKSNISLVGNTKVMAHFLPNLIPPVDRQYTLNYLYNKNYIPNNIDKEWNMLKDILLNFFYPIANDTDFLELSQSWINQPDLYPWDTSTLKTIDNIIIGSKK